MHRMRSTLAATLLAFVFIFGFIDLTATPVAAQSTSDAPQQTAHLAGTVLDQDGQPVAGAQVDINQWGYRTYETEPVDPDAPDDEPKTGGGSSGSAGSTDSGAAVSDPSYPYYEDGYQRLGTDDAGRFEADVYAGWLDISIWKDGYARFYEGFEIADGDSAQTFEMTKYPDKTARIEGRVTDAATGDALRWASIHIENPEFGTYECSIHEGDQSRGDGAEPVAPPATQASGDAMQDDATADTMIAPDIAYYDPGCSITVHDDGTFEGLVTPGYSIIRVHHDAWRACQGDEARFAGPCGQQYFSISAVRTLQEGDNRAFDIQLTPRPGPDAGISGYAVDTSTGTAVPDAHVSFSNQLTYGWSSTQTDEDGSYSVRLGNGYVQVSAWAEGYFPWEGVIEVPAGGSVAFDIPLVPGQPLYGGGCCYAFAEDGIARGVATDETTATAGEGAAPQASGDDADGSTTQAEAFEDLGGGLGPYDAAQRQDAMGGEVQDTPAAGVLALLAAVAALAMLGRRRD